MALTVIDPIAISWYDRNGKDSSERSEDVTLAKTSRDFGPAKPMAPNSSVTLESLTSKFFECCSSHLSTIKAIGDFHWIRGYLKLANRVFDKFSPRNMIQSTCLIFRYFTLKTCQFNQYVYVFLLLWVLPKQLSSSSSFPLEFEFRPVLIYLQALVWFVCLHMLIFGGKLGSVAISR